MTIIFVVLERENYEKMDHLLNMSIEQSPVNIDDGLLRPHDNTHIV